MAGDESSKADRQAAEAANKKLETLSAEGRKLIGKAIIDGLVTPAATAGIVSAFAQRAYIQDGGNYTQKGNDHYQGGNGDYNQAPAMTNLQDIVSVIAQAGAVIRE